ncbi:class I SAM-dependent methyltransferase (plasmid) [Burkholderia thailandensis]|nr:class I SAM-dependent methyltransferase [Burkholderia thailandensis]QRA15382.1 class I SAM-dependent methyltransferase [Burkholderia thailandensis]
MATAVAQTADDTNQTLKAAIDGQHRTPAFKQRDRYRHPLATLEFFGIRPDMSVVEVLPGAGWYTEILAPFLKERGRLIEATPPVSSANPFYRKMANMYEGKLLSNPEIYGKVQTLAYEPPEYMPLGAPESADMIATFLNLHDFVYVNTHGEVTDAIMQRFFQSAYQALKPGGVLGIVEHRARAGESVSDAIPKGRIPQSYVIQQAMRAGFELAGTSEINANPKDDGSYPVWYLPPTLKLGNKDRDKYLAIGESDDMTLRFIKRSIDHPGDVAR